MKKFSAIVSIFLFSTFLFCSQVFAIPMQLTIESILSDIFPQVSINIDLIDPNDQVEIAEQAGLFALSSEGWNLAASGAFLEIREPPDWTGTFFILAASTNETSPFDLNTNLYFHTDEWAQRGSHDVCERPNNFGVINSDWGLGNPNWHACFEPDWGSFWVEPITSEPTDPIPEPSTMLLLGSGLLGMVFWRRKKGILNETRQYD